MGTMVLHVSCWLTMYNMYGARTLALELLLKIDNLAVETLKDK